jgi:hypothetical protein
MKNGTVTKLTRPDNNGARPWPDRNNFAARVLNLLGLLLLCAGAPATAAEFLANTTTAGQQEYPSVAMDSDGDFVITWQDQFQDGFFYGVYAQRYNSSGVAQGSEFQVNTYTTNEQQYPSVAMDSDGDFVITWQSLNQDGSGWGIYAQRYNSSGVAQGAEFQVNTTWTGYQRYPSVAMDDAGNFVIAWENGSSPDIYAQRYNAAGVAQGGEFPVNAYTTSDQVNPSVAIDADGDFVITWASYGQDGQYGGIYAQRYSRSGGAVGNEFRVNTTTTGNQVRPSAAIDDAGNFVITWNSYGQDGPGWSIYAQRYSSNGVPVGSEFRVDTYTPVQQQYQTEPKVAMDDAGNFVITWTSNALSSSTDFQYRIYAQRYNSSGVAQGRESQVNTTWTGYHFSPVVAMSDANDLLISWMSFVIEPGESTFSYGIHADLFINNDAPVAVNDSLSVNEDSSDNSVNVLSNDRDDDGDTLTIIGSSVPANGSTQGTWNGTVSQVGPWNGILYTPNANYFGPDSFSYSISDNNGRTATATVTVNVLAVNDAPSFIKAPTRR